MKRKSSKPAMRILNGGLSEKEADTIPDEKIESFADDVRNLRPPEILKVQGQIIWRKAAEKLLRAGLSLDDHEESLLLLAYAWQKFQTRLSSGRDMKMTEIKSMNNLLNEYGLGPGKKNRSLTASNGKKSRRAMVSKMADLQNMRDTDD